MPRRFERHRVEHQGQSWPVLVALGGDPVSWAPRGGSTDEEEALAEALQAHPGTCAVVFVAPDLALDLPPDAPVEAAMAGAMAYLRRIATTLRALVAHEVRVAVFAGWTRDQIDVVVAARDQVLDELRRAGPSSSREERSALASLPVWSTSEVDRVLTRRLPGLLSGLGRRPRATTISPSEAMMAEVLQPYVKAASPTSGSRVEPDPYRGALAMTATGVVHLSYWQREATVEEVARLHEEIEGLAARMDSSLVVMLVVVEGVPFAVAEARARAVKLLGDLDQVIDGVALVLLGTGMWATTVRSMFQGILLVSRTRVTWKVFSDLEAAHAWGQEVTSVPVERFPSWRAVKAALVSLRPRRPSNH